MTAEAALTSDELRQQIARVRQQRHELAALGDRALDESLLVQVNKSLRDRQEVLEDYGSAQESLRSTQAALQRSMQWTALVDCFDISHQGPFGTINGLRLGAEADHKEQAETRRLFAFAPPPSTPGEELVFRVPWNEINAALGQLALLLSTLEQHRHCGIRYRHSILPCGSTSKIRRADGGLYNIYSDDSFQFFGKRNFNVALDCLLECVIDAAEAIQQRDRTVSLPHLIERKGHEYIIGGIPIAYGQGGAEWTRAMKYLLTNCKHLLSFKVFGLT